MDEQTTGRLDSIFEALDAPVEPVAGSSGICDQSVELDSIYDALDVPDELLELSNEEAAAHR